MPKYNIVLKTGTTHNIELSGNTINNIFLYAPITTTTTTTMLPPEMSSFSLFVDDASIGEPESFSITVNDANVSPIPTFDLFVEEADLENEKGYSLSIYDGVIDTSEEESYSITVNNGDIENAESYSITIENGEIFEPDTPITTTTTTTIILKGVEMIWDDIENVPVKNVSSIYDWNNHFDLPNNGNEFTSISVIDNTVILYGGSDIYLVDTAFYQNENILSFIDNSESIIDMGDGVFQSAISITHVHIPATVEVSEACCAGAISLESAIFESATYVAIGAFHNSTSLTYINIESCTNLGGSVGDNWVFSGITGNEILLTVPEDLMVCNNGEPDGDIQILIDNNNTFVSSPNAIITTWDNINNVPVDDENSVSNWNTFFDLPNSGNEFTSVKVTGDTVYLYGGSDINLIADFDEPDNQCHLVSIVDSGCVISIESLFDVTYFPIEQTSTLTTAVFPNVVTIVENCFKGVNTLTDIYFPLLTTIPDYAFNGCSLLTNPTFPSVTHVGYYSFSYSGLIDPSFPELLTVASGLGGDDGGNSFSDCSDLTNPSFPKLTNIGEYCFIRCENLLWDEFDLIETVGAGAFNKCSSINNFNLPLVTSIGPETFQGCYGMAELYIPNCIDLGGYVFDNKVFHNSYGTSDITGNTITLTVPDILMTCYDGNPDGDIQWLQANNTVTVTPPTTTTTTTNTTPPPQFWVGGSGYAESSNTLAYSTDSINWVGLGMTLFDTVASIDNNGSTWVAVGSGSNHIAYSTDGSNWIGLGTSVLTYNGEFVKWDGSKFIVFSFENGNTDSAYSTDGINWYPVTGYTLQLTCMDYNGGIYVAGGYGLDTIAYSYDGLNWVGLGYSILYAGNGVAYGNGVWVIVGDSVQKSAYSYDGINFSGATLEYDMYDIIFDGTEFIAVGVGSVDSNPVGGVISKSTDGINWVTIQYSDMFIVFAIQYNNYKYVISGLSGTTSTTLSYSDDAINWTTNGNTIFDSGYGGDISAIPEIIIPTTTTTTTTPPPLNLAISYGDVTGVTISTFLPSGKNVVLNWGDGTSENITGNDSTPTISIKTYSVNGTYQISYSGDYSDITKLDCSNANLHGSVSDWNKLTSIIELNCEQNSLSGDISSWSTLTNLSYLNCSSAALVGDVSSWSTLTNLTYLSCAYLSLSGDISSWSSLTNLTYLDCSFSDFTGDISSWSSLTNLTYLDCQYNDNLSGDISSWSSLTNLTHLDCYRNNLSGDVSSYITLTELTYLNLRQNELSGDVSSWSGLTNLTYLDCYSNNLSGDVSSWSTLTELTDLYCYGNNLSGDISSWSTLTNMVRINCSGNDFTGDVSSWSTLTGLTSLNCSSNELSGDISSWSGLTNLTNLYLTYNNFNCNISSWSSLINLTYIDCGNNQYLNGDVSSWSALTKLRYVQCNFTDVSGDVSSWSTLTDLIFMYVHKTNVTFDSSPVWTSSNIVRFFSEDNAMTSTMVDNILISLNYGGVTDAAITLSGSNAARTSASNVAYSSLIINGNTIFVN